MPKSPDLPTQHADNRPDACNVETPGLHEWNVTPAEARAIQNRLRHHVVCRDRLRPVRYVAGADVGFEQNNRVTRAAVAVLRFPELKFHESAIVRRPTVFPYVSGLLSFREAPALLAAIASLRRVPDLMLFDGQGIAHPRRIGIASHMGLWTVIPSIGVAKTRLTGEHPPVPDTKGSRVPLTDNGEIIGTVLRTRTNVRPLYVSPGHNISLETAVSYVMACITRYRLPETTRWAHSLAST